MRFSHRLPTSLEENRLSRAVAARRARGAPLYDLTETNPTRVGLALPPWPLQALSAPENLVYAPDPRGLDSARQAVVEHYRARNLSVGKERIFVTASTSETYSFLFKLLCDPGDNVLVPAPSYPLFEHLARLEGVELTHYPLRYHQGWFVDADELAELIGPRTRAIVVVHPNNPTGSFLKRNEAARLLAFCRERDLALISDEVFGEYEFGPAPERWPSFVESEDALAFCMAGLSKRGLPQLKLGWLVIGGPAGEAARASAALELIADTFLSVSSPVQHAAASLFAFSDQFVVAIRDRLEKNRRALKAIAGDKLRVLDCEGGWSTIVRAPPSHDEEAWALQLIDDGVLVHPGYFFDFAEDGYLVLSLLPQEAEFSQAAARLTARLGE